MQYADFMEIIPRLMEKALREAASYYPVVTLTGPRQSGKTTLLHAVWPEKTYASLENPDTMDFVQADPRGFLLQGEESGMVIDEAQRYPPLFNYLQGYADRSSPGRYIISGSSNFLLMEKIGQSLAGRTAVLSLLPFSAAELGREALEANWENAAWRGFYPRVRCTSLPPDLFARDYIATYVERDVRLVRNIGDLESFRRFVRLCAGRAGQILSIASLAGDAGISVNTAKSWLGLLQAAWLVFLLPAWHRNLNKRIVKSPKLYWHDTNLLCFLLDVRKPEDLAFHPLRGAVFENLIIAERFKAATHRGRTPSLHFWRDSTGREVDLVENAGDSGSTGKTGGATSEGRAWECKSGMTVPGDFFRHLALFGEEAGVPPERRILAYGGMESQTRSDARVLGWQDALLEP
jgi:hypothetical protein